MSYSKRLPFFFCRGCGTRKINAPMLREEVWAEASAVYPMCVMPALRRASPPPDFLCIACVEKALGRMLDENDLLDYNGNDFTRLLALRIRTGLT